MPRPICVVVDFVYPPIPVRHFDWLAYEDGMEERQQYGYGCTRADAVSALFELLEDEES